MATPKQNDRPAQHFQRHTTARAVTLASAVISNDFRVECGLVAKSRSRYARASNVRSAGLAVVMVVLAACRHGRLEYGSARDVEALLAGHGATVKVADCGNVKAGGSTTRALSCTTVLSRAELARLKTS